MRHPFPYVRLAHSPCPSMCTFPPCMHCPPTSLVAGCAFCSHIPTLHVRPCSPSHCTDYATRCMDSPPTSLVAAGAACCSHIPALHVRSACCSHIPTLHVRPCSPLHCTDYATQCMKSPPTSGRRQRLLQPHPCPAQQHYCWASRQAGLLPVAVLATVLIAAGVLAPAPAAALAGGSGCGAVVVAAAAAAEGGGAR
eukprot:1162128-Pelagomonas_calceolata.AAC.14